MPIMFWVFAFVFVVFVPLDFDRFSKSILFRLDSKRSSLDKF